MGWGGLGQKIRWGRGRERRKEKGEKERYVVGGSHVRKAWVSNDEKRVGPREGTAVDGKGDKFYSCNHLYRGSSFSTPLYTCGPYHPSLSIIITWLYLYPSSFSPNFFFSFCLFNFLLAIFFIVYCWIKLFNMFIINPF